MLNVETQTRINTDVLIRDPHEREETEEISAPIRKQKFVTCDDKESECHVVAEAILAGKYVEQFAAREVAGRALPFAIVPRFAKYFLVRSRPGDASYWERQ